ncbi:MAG: hypothetical protein ACHQKY_08910, partial [Terriglobia bacterium]
PRNIRVTLKAEPNHESSIPIHRFWGALSETMKVVDPLSGFTLHPITRGEAHDFEPIDFD